MYATDISSKRADLNFYYDYLVCERMADDDEEQVDFGDFSLSVHIGVFTIVTIGSAGSLLLLAEFTQTPPGALESAFGRYIRWMGVVLAGLLVVGGIDVVSTYLKNISPIEVGEDTGKSMVFGIIIASMILFALWNVIALLVSPIAISFSPYQMPKYGVWTFASKVSLELILTVSALGVILLVVVLVLRLLFDIIISGMDTFGADDGAD